jgi:hypothetical protein
MSRLRSTRRCSVCGGENLARNLCNIHYHAARNNGTLNQYPLDDEIPVREPWSWAGDEESLIAADLENRVVENLMHAFQESETPGERKFEIDGVTFIVRGTETEMNQRERETRQFYAKGKFK